MTRFTLIKLDNCLNESPSEKEGKWVGAVALRPVPKASMKVPPKRKGNTGNGCLVAVALNASMKVPPKRKGNGRRY